MNIVFLYNDDFQSFMALLAELEKRKIKPYNIKNKKKYCPNLLEETVELEIDNKNMELLKRNLSTRAIKIVYYAFLVEFENKEIIIYEFLKKYEIYKEKVYYYQRFDCVNKVLKWAKRVKAETHKMKGFLRFKQIQNNIYYAIINPTNNILPLIAKHFEMRLRNSFWIIKDENRNIYAIYNKKRIFYITEENIEPYIKLSEEELEIENLWKTFFQTVSIKERKNLKCQRNFMPKKYWKNIIEMEKEK